MSTLSVPEGCVVLHRYIPVALELQESNGPDPGWNFLNIRAGPRLYLPVEQQSLRAWYQGQGGSLQCMAVTNATPVL